MKLTMLLRAALLVGLFELPVTAGEPEVLPPAEARPIIIHRYVRVNESLPELGARLFHEVDYTRKLRKLDSEIKLAKLDIENGRQTVYEYEKYFRYTSALLLSRQQAKRDLLDAELRLKRLRQEKLLALRHRADQVRYRKLLLTAGKETLILDDGDEATAVRHEPNRRHGRPILSGL